MNWPFWPEAVTLFFRRGSRKGSSLSSKPRSVANLCSSAKNAVSNSHMPDKTNYSQADTRVFINRTVEGGEAGQEYSVQVLRTGASKRGEGGDGTGRDRTGQATAALFNTSMQACSACSGVLQNSVTLQQLTFGLIDSKTAVQK